MYKDEILNKLADDANVAQFVSFAPNGSQRFSRVFGFDANCKFDSLSVAVSALLQSSPEKSINVRSFKPDQPQGNEFHYGLTEPQVAIDHIIRLTVAGFHVIINETVDVDDGGVSGVLQGGCLEFAPGVIPRFVDKDSDTPVSTLPKDLAVELLKTVYGFYPKLEYPSGYRVEFSIHPKVRGWQHQHTIIWEVEKVSEVSIQPYLSWPNLFSMFLGDKIYGLLLAHLYGALVPRTTCFSRNNQIGLFTFGHPTGSGEVWTRTCPKVQEPGRFSTVHNWVDPFSLMNRDDPSRESIVSCIVQEGVESKYSGALITDSEGMPIIEGVKGFGDKFMQGTVAGQNIPTDVISALNEQYEFLSKQMGPVRFEWAFDGTQVWVLQLHTGRSVSSSRVIVPGEPLEWLQFIVGSPLNLLRNLVQNAKKNNSGLKVVGNVGMSSHVADILRKAQVPSVIVARE
ncbi:MAG: hypothetical protein PHI97_19485 [Desulfobulbus sp.]|nr:hypothetical protein [Desulfobulbus sp.]